MSKSIRDMSAEEIQSLQYLGLDDSFEFKCKECGKCCKNRHDILLTPYDLYRVAGFLGRTPQEFLERYCDVYEGHSSHFPVVRILPIAPDNVCPFLRNKKCVLHARKPVVCRVYPLSRVFIDGDTRYHFGGAGCKHEPKSITVREWIADVASEESEQAAQRWGETVQTLLPLLHPDKLKVPTDVREKILGVVHGILWLNYDMKEPFVPQLTRNAEKLMSMFEDLNEGLSQINL